MSEAVLIVDDEDPVRRTFQEWLASSGLDIRVFTAADAEAALLIANDNDIDLAILDWNLGSGSDGLQLLEDLVEFHPDIVAILVTGFAHQATPLDALRMGVRDYLDKNQNLTRETFLASVRKQLDRARPAKRQRLFHQSLAAFRQAVEKVLPIVRASAALNDPLPLPDAVRSLLRFLGRTVGATDGVLIVRHFRDDGKETTITYGRNGPVPPAAVPFNRSLAASVLSLQEPCVINDFNPATLGAVELTPLETNRSSILAVPLLVASGTQAVLELFDKPAPGFTDPDRRLAAAAADVGGDMLRQAMAERQTHRLLFDAVEAALAASSRVAESIDVADGSARTEKAPQAVMDQLKLGLEADANAVLNADSTLKLVEAVRNLALRHGPAAVDHCVRLVADLCRLLDELTGTGPRAGDTR